MDLVTHHISFEPGNLLFLADFNARIFSLKVAYHFLREGRNFFLLGVFTLSQGFVRFLNHNGQ
jgi:hypothetical protein